MRKLIASLALAAAVFAGSLAPSQAALVTNLGTVSGDASFSLAPLDPANTLGAFVDDYQFTLQTYSFLSTSGVTNAFIGGSQFVTGLYMSLYSGAAPGGSVLQGPIAAISVGSLQVAGLPQYLLAPGTYYVEIGGSYSGTPHFGATLALTAQVPPPGNTGGVPEPSTWAMMVLGFLGLGLVAYRRRGIGSGMQFRAA